MRTLKLMSTTLLLSAALAACGGAPPSEDPSQNDPVQEEEQEQEEQQGDDVVAGYDKPGSFADPCAGMSDVVRSDVVVRQDTDMARLDGVTLIVGDLSITGVSSMAPLACLREVTGSVSIHATESLKDGAGLESLATIGGGLWITENAQLTTLEQLRVLRYVGLDIVVERNEALVELDGITRVSGGLRGGLWVRDNDALARISGFENLEVIGDGVVISGNPSLAYVTGFSGGEAPTQSFGGIVVEHNDQLGSLELPMMGVDRSDNELRIQDNPMLREVRMHSNQKLRVTGDIVVVENPILSLVDFGNVKYAEADVVIVDNDALSSLAGLRGLAEVRGSVEIQSNDSLADVALVRLTSIGGDLIVARNTSLGTLGGLGSLGEVQGEVIIADNPQLDECTLAEMEAQLDGTRTTQPLTCGR